MNSFFQVNLVGFFPGIISYFFPLIIGFIGLYLIRLEFSGIRNLDILLKDYLGTIILENQRNQGCLR